MAETKVCTKCGIEKNKSEFYKDQHAKDNLTYQCKKCRDQSLKAWRDKNVFRTNKVQPDYKKKCSKCGEIKEKNKFHRDKYTIDGLKLWCIECCKNYRKTNLEEEKLRARRYYLINKEKFNLRSREYWQKNKEMQRIKRKEWRAKNIIKITKHDKKRNQAPILFDNYSHNLTETDEAPIADDNGYLLAKCTYCGRYYYPTRAEVTRRDQALKGQATGENRLYCSDNCKKACPIFMQVNWPKGYKSTTSREVQPELRQMRLACDEYTCQRCGKTIDDAQLHCHHIEGTVQNPIESADLDNTITLCKKCHKWAHTQEGCRYFELRCE